MIKTYTKFELIKENFPELGSITDLTLEKIYNIYRTKPLIFERMLGFKDIFTSLVGLHSIRKVFEIYGKYFADNKIEIDLIYFEQYLSNEREYNILYINKSIANITFIKNCCVDCYYGECDEDADGNVMNVAYKYHLLPYNEMNIMYKLYMTAPFYIDPRGIEPSQIFELGIKDLDWYLDYNIFIDGRYTKKILNIYKMMKETKYHYGGEIDHKLDRLLFRSFAKEREVYKNFMISDYEDTNLIRLYRFIVKNNNFVSSEFINIIYLLMCDKVDSYSLRYYSLDNSNDLITYYPRKEEPDWSIYARNNINSQPEEIKVYLKHLKAQLLNDYKDVRTLDLYTPSQTDGFESYWDFDLKINYQ